MGKVEIPLHRHIVIHQEGGEWYDRYHEGRPDGQPAATITRHLILHVGNNGERNDGLFEVWRDPSVDDLRWRQAINALTGKTTYDGLALRTPRPKNFEAEDITW